jgi:hypothetical protein
LLSEQNNLGTNKSLQETMEEMDFKWLKNDMLGRIMLGTSFILFFIISFLVVPVYAIFKDFFLDRNTLFTVDLPFCFILYYIFIAIFFSVKYVLYRIYIYYEISLDGVEFQNITRNVTLILMALGCLISFYILFEFILTSSLRHR